MVLLFILSLTVICDVPSFFALMDKTAKNTFVKVFMTKYFNFCRIRTYGKNCCVSNFMKQLLPIILLPTLYERVPSALYSY